MKLEETCILSSCLTDRLAEKGIYLALVEISSVKRALEEKQFANDLSRQEWSIAKSYRQIDRKLSWLSGQIAGKYAYQKMYPNIRMNDFEILRNEIGAPFIANEENVSVSISHSDNYAIASLCENSIGIDIEKTTERPQSFINTWLSIREQEVANSLFDDEKNIFVNKCWTVKEAYSKLLGIGGHLPFKRFCSIEHPAILEIEKESFQFRNCIISIVWDKQKNKKKATDSKELDTDKTSSEKYYL